MRKRTHCLKNSQKSHFTTFFVIFKFSQWLKNETFLWILKHVDETENNDLRLLFLYLQNVWSSLTFTSSGKVSKTVFRRPSCISSSITSRIICNHNLCHHFTNKKRFLHYSQNQNMLGNEEKRLRKCLKHCKKPDKSLVKSGKHMSGNSTIKLVNDQL